MQIGKLNILDDISIEVQDLPAHSLEDLAEMFGLNTNVSDFPPMSDIDTLHRRNATAIKRSLKCN